MTLWQLELARLRRTNRGLVLAGIYAFFAVVGPLTARYLEQILGRVGELDIVVPEPVPADGIAQFTGNASQLGLLAVVVVAAGALAIHANREIAVFLRTRTDGPWQLLRPRYAVTTLAAVAALVLGTAIATVVTTLLLGAPDLLGVVVGTAYGAVYLAFAVAVTAAVAAVARSVLMTVLGTVATLLALPLVALWRPVRRFVPSELVGAIDALVRGEALDAALPAAVVAVAASAGLLALASYALGRREV